MLTRPWAILECHCHIDISPWPYRDHLAIYREINWSYHSTILEYHLSISEYYFSISTDHLLGQTEISLAIFGYHLVILMNHSLGHVVYEGKQGFMEAGRYCRCFWFHLHIETRYFTDGLSDNTVPQLLKHLRYKLKSRTVIIFTPQKKNIFHIFDQIRNWSSYKFIPI